MRERTTLTRNICLKSNLNSCLIDNTDLLMISSLNKKNMSLLVFNHDSILYGGAVDILISTVGQILVERYG